MTDKDLNIITEEIQKDGKDSFHFHRYEPTPYEVLDELFSYFSLSKNDKVIDYGCGLGRLNFYIEKLYRINSIGLEANEEYYLRANKNLTTYKGCKDNIKFVNAKAEEFIVPDDYNVFYFFNPFSVDIFHSVLNRILDSYEKNTRELTLILYYPEDDTIFFIENHTMFKLVDEIAASDNVFKDRREKFCIYKLS